MVKWCKQTLKRLYPVIDWLVARLISISGTFVCNRYRVARDANIERLSSIAAVGLNPLAWQESMLTDGSGVDALTLDHEHEQDMISHTVHTIMVSMSKQKYVCTVRL
eukprot:scaffold14974_cov195-Amphora_coffeaeformis.AAC.49